jgi:N-methylhydantoinase A
VTSVGSPERPYSIGVDIGGTFTDCAVLDDAGAVVTGKAPTTPSDFSVGFFDAISACAGVMDLSLPALLAHASRLAHGTTTGLNALLDGRGAKVLLVTTAGHADAIRIMNSRGRALGASMAELLDWSISSQPDPILPKEQVLEVHERVDCLGNVVVEMTESEISKVVAAVRERQVQAVAVSLLWSFANRVHEDVLRRRLVSACPDVSVSCSYEVAPRLGHYPRTVTTIMNASLTPLMSDYAERITARARQLGFASEVLFVQNDGGLLPSGEAARFPVSTLRSGPVAGVVGTALVGSLQGEADIVTADMGGTTFDVSVIHGGHPGRSNETVIRRQMLHLRSVDVESIGAGGGSIAWVDERTGLLRVGPHSAGAVPGPICYGRGGTAVTVTDADLALGVLNPDRPFAGGSRLNREAAVEALGRLGQRLGLDPISCAAGIVEIVDSLMEDLVRRVTVQRGYDPRDFSLWIYGGAAGAHAGLFSRQLHVRRIVLPLGDTASVWSALGATLLQRRREFQKSVYMPPPWNLRQIGSELQQLETDAESYAAGWSFDTTGVQVRRSADMKYGLQVHEVEAPLPSGPVDDGWAKELTADFESAYERRFGAGTGFSGAGVTLTALRVVVESAAGARSVPAVVPERPVDEWRPAEMRRVFWRELDDWADTPILHGQSLRVDESIDGPAIVEYAHTTVVARPEQRLRMERFGNLILELARRSL